MSKTISGIPESFTREQYISFFEAVGVTPSDVSSLSFLAQGVEAVVFERDAEGARVLTGDAFAKHTIFIPVVDDEEEGA